jgi:hypothetical protein
LPTATHKDPFHAIEEQKSLNTVLPLPVQFIPSEEVASVSFVPLPPATHKDPFHATELQPESNTVFPLPVQVIPSGEVASV